jgi:hypothetical protein
MQVQVSAEVRVRVRVHVQANASAAASSSCAGVYPPPRTDRLAGVRRIHRHDRHSLTFAPRKRAAQHRVAIEQSPGPTRVVSPRATALVGMLKGMRTFAGGLR